MVQHGTPSQIERFVDKALRKDEVWCQLFSEPGAGSDAAAIKTRAVRVDGGWKINGQKVWTSGRTTRSAVFSHRADRLRRGQARASPP